MIVEDGSMAPKHDAPKNHSSECENLMLLVWNGYYRLAIAHHFTCIH